MSKKLLSKPAFIVAAAATTVVAAGLGHYIWQEEHRPPLLEIYIFALKTGQATFIRTPTDQRILIDGGANSEIIRRLTRVLPFYSRRIDAILVTSLQGKNVSGLIDILERYHVGRVYLPGVVVGDHSHIVFSSSTDPIYETFLATISDKDIPITHLEAGDTATFDPSTRAEILFPLPETQFTYSKSSLPDLAFNLTYGSTSIVFLNTISKSSQRAIATAHPSLTSGKGVEEATSSVKSAETTALVVSQSGVAANMSPELVQKVTPDYFIFSKNETASEAPSKGTSVRTKAQKTPDKTPAKKTTLKPPPDPLADMPPDHRFNVRQLGALKIVSDGQKVEIILLPQLF